jgi:hypothetical protein
MLSTYVVHCDLTPHFAKAQTCRNVAYSLICFKSFGTSYINIYIVFELLYNVTSKDIFRDFTINR